MWCLMERGLGTNDEKLYWPKLGGLGLHTKAMAEFFEAYPDKQAKVLDVGSGQGRDVLFIAWLEHQVGDAGISAQI